MAKSKLLSALDAHKGRNFKLENDKKLRKAAEKRKSAKRERHAAESDEELDDFDSAPTNGVGQEETSSFTRVLPEDMSEEDVATGDDADDAADTNGMTDDDDSAEEEEEENDIPLSDLESLSEEDREDIIPHQRLTINNTAALRASITSIALPISKLPFSEHQSIISSESVTIADVNDDLTREQAFYTQSLAAAKQARSLLKKEGFPFARPSDYFAEMVKSDEHMGKIKKKLYDEAAAKKASAEARKQRDLKKFGKQVQVAKLQERDKAKRETLEKISSLKRKRRGAEPTATADEDLFDIALDDTDKAGKGKAGKGADGLKFKRQKKDKKFGFGGKKRFSKSGDATSTADLSGFSVKKMKSQKSGPRRLGKSRRSKA